MVGVAHLVDRAIHRNQIGGMQDVVYPKPEKVFIIGRPHSPTGSGISGQVQSAHIGQVSVGMVVPPNKSQTQYWYNLTVYGQRLYQLLISKAPAGMFKFGTFQRVYWANVRGLGGVA